MTPKVCCNGMIFFLRWRGPWIDNAVDRGTGKVEVRTSKRVFTCRALFAKFLCSICTLSLLSLDVRQPGTGCDQWAAARNMCLWLFTD